MSARIPTIGPVVYYIRRAPHYHRRSPSMTYPNPIPPHWAPQPPRPPATNVAAIIALTAALIGLVVLPILLGPVAIVAGIVGEHQARVEGRKLGKAALGGIVIGVIVTLIALDRVLPLS